MFEMLECPYCKEYVNINVEGHYDTYKQYRRPNCGKNFEVFAETTTEYTVGKKADCLNGGKNEWVQRESFPENAARGRYKCKNCSETKTVESEVATKETQNGF